MKKITFILFAAFFTFSAFAFILPTKLNHGVADKPVTHLLKKKSKKLPQYYWYSVVSNIASGTVANSDCFYLNYGPSPASTACTGPATYYCIVGLSSQQVNTTTHAVVGNQLPTIVQAYRGVND